ncbi:SUMO-interacting motif-containing protein 1-like [Xyrauchen texanus]|uniref:SUMO-interacting motif-containing protein 1-like n=1 Tax=Xyrauchen texanus TaxID=154827 RepID=UPI0022423DF4|nr:SUMO-interacting motif-containing protein 1-like [Xyrauchen texanus]
MDDIVCVSSGSDNDSDLEVISSYKEVKEDAVPFIRAEWLPVTPVLIDIAGHNLVPPHGRFSRKDTCSTLEVIDLSGDCHPDYVDVQLQNPSLAVPSVDCGDKHVIPTSIRKSQESESQTNNLEKERANSGCFVGSSVQSVVSKSLSWENNFTQLHIERTGDLLHQDTNCNSSLPYEQLSWDEFLGNCISSSKIPLENASEVLKNSIVDLTQNTKDAQLSFSSPATSSIGTDQENAGSIDSSQKWNASVHSLNGLDSPFYCPSEVDAYIFSDESNKLEDKDHPFTTCSGQQSPQISEHLSDIQTESASNPVASKKDCQTMNMGESEHIHKMPVTQVELQPSSPSISASSWALPPCSPELKSGQNQPSKPNSPTSTEILASDTAADSPALSLENSLSSPLSFSISLPPSPAFSERAELRRNDLDAVSLDGPSARLWETSTSNSGDNEVVLDNLSDLSEDNTQGRQHICLAQYRKLRQYMGGTAAHMHEDEEEDEHYGPAEPLCRQSLSLVYSTIEENYPEGTLQLLSDFIQPLYCPPVDITSHLLKGIFLDPQSPDVLAIESYNLLMKTQRYHPVDTSTVPWDWELLMSVMEEQDDTRRLQTTVKNMLLQYVLQVLEDDFQFKLTTQRLQHSIAKTKLSCDQRFRQVRDILNWIMTAAKESVMHSNDVEYPKKEKDNFLKILLSLQRMLTLALEVDRTPTCSSSKLAQELFHSLNSTSPCRQLRLLLLSTMESKLLRCKLLELLLDEACSPKRRLPMSLSLLLHYLQSATLASDPSDGAERWRKWDELLQLLWMLMLSYEEVVTGHLRCPVPERFDRTRAPVWTVNDQVTRLAVREAAEAFLCRTAKDIGYPLPMEMQESLSQLQEHLTEISSVIPRK